MDIAKQLDEFIEKNEENVRIEVEGCPGRLEYFIGEYNHHHEKPISVDTDGIHVLDQNTNHWHLYYRLLMHTMPDCVDSIDVYVRDEYTVLVNDSGVISLLLDLGYTVGVNSFK